MHSFGRFYWLLEPRRRAERVLVAVVVQCSLFSFRRPRGSVNQGCACLTGG